MTSYFAGYAAIWQLQQQERARLGEMDRQLGRLVAQRERAAQEHEALSAADVAAKLAEIERGYEKGGPAATASPAS